MKAIERAVSIVGSQDKLAQALGVSQALISQWLKGAAVHVRHFAGIHEATEGQVTPEELLADEMAKVAVDGAQRRSGVAELATVVHDT